jgi:clan AA aspartic protease (TIGR02281 family)
MYQRLCKLLSLCLLISLCGNYYLYQQVAFNPETRQITKIPIEQLNYRQTNNVEAQNVAPNVVIYNEISLAFNANDFNLAIEKYDDILKIDDTLAAKIRNEWRLQIKHWLNNDELENAKLLLQALLHYQPYAPEFLELEAYRLELVGQFNEAIELYYILLSNILEPEETIRVEVLLHASIQQYLDILTLEHKNDEFIELLERAIYEEPEHYPYQLTLARKLAELTDFNRAKEILSEIVDLPQIGLAASELLEKINKLEQGKQAIPLEQVGSHYIVAGQFGQQADISLMIDTGATLSVMTQQHFDHLSSWQYPTFVRRSEFNTAGGLIDAPIYRFDKFSIGGYIVENMEFAVIDLVDFSSSNGLLGMNFLQHFVFQLDQQSKTLFLQYR